MRRLLLLLASAVVIVVGSVAPSLAGNGIGPHDLAGQDSQDAAAAIDWFTSQRLAPNGYINPNAFAAVGAQASQLPVVHGNWSERTNQAGANGTDFSDSPQYIDPTSGFSNSGAGDRWVGGRMTALAASPDGGTVFAGAADGGVWRSTDGGQTWTPTMDTQNSMSIGALLTVASTGGYTLYAGTGEANTSFDAYAGVGVLMSTDGGSSWTATGNGELNGALIFRLAQDNGTILAATSFGLYRFDSAADVWKAILQPAGPLASNPNLTVGDMISDVAVRPGTNGLQILAAAGWRGGASTNGLYLSNDGGATFTRLTSPKGWVQPQDEGRVTLAYSAQGDRLYAIVQSPYLLTVGTNGKTVLAGAFSSANGDPQGPWTQIAQSEQLANSGSAQNFKRIGQKTYAPGVQAWYNQSLVVDPANKDHVYMGLEEVYESVNGGGKWNTIAPYWNFGFSCFSYIPFEGTCNHNQAHSDQHAAIVVKGKVYIGNDGGVYAKSLSDHSVGNWEDLNQHLDALQFYSATSSSSGDIYGGMQDNGSSHVFTTPTTVQDDGHNSISVSSVQVFGGDGGYTVVDPNNPSNVITEYTSLTALQSTNGGADWHFINPSDPNPRFIAPIELDRTNPNHLVAGGAMVWNSDSGVGGTNSPGKWTAIYDVRNATGGTGSSTVTALDAVTVGGVEYVAAAWCGPCNVSFPGGGGFKSGIVMLNNKGGTWSPTSVCTGSLCTGGLPKRYISGVRIDPNNVKHAYVTISGFSRHWNVGPDDPGTGHLFQSTDGGSNWTDVSGHLPDNPADDVVIEPSGKLVVATDFGVYVSGGAVVDNTTAWSRLGDNLPNVAVNQLTLGPDGKLVAATHGRGVWTIAAP